jgi:hypothetical protein
MLKVKERKGKGKQGFSKGQSSLTLVLLKAHLRT